MFSWGDSFDVAGEFAGLLNKRAQGTRNERFHLLQTRISQQGLAKLSDEERAEYLQLLRLNQPK
jgi:hypothetical protein